MTLGKQKCKILKEIRQRIADENEIPYVTRECHFQGECRGTCPRCESELRYLEQQLALRTAMGKKVAVAALCASMTLTAGCTPFGSSSPGSDITGTPGPPHESTQPAETPEVFVTTGEVAWPEETEDPCNTPPPEKTEPVEEIELSGDVAYPDLAG